jgi:hypothetical protein
MVHGDEGLPEQPLGVGLGASVNAHVEVVEPHVESLLLETLLMFLFDLQLLLIQVV